MARGGGSKRARGESSRAAEHPEEPVAQEVVIDSMGLVGLNPQQRVTWSNLCRPRREVQCTKFFDTDFLAQLGLLEGLRGMFQRAGLGGSFGYAPQTYKRCVYEFLSTLTIEKPARAPTRVLFRMHDRVRECSLGQIRTAFGWSAPLAHTHYVPLTDIGGFWSAISGLPLHSGGEKISNIRHPALRLAAYFLNSNICCKGETGKLNQVEICLLRTFLPGSVGIPDWANIWLSACVEVRTKLSGHISMGGMITQLISHLGYGPTEECGPVSPRYLLFNARGLHKLQMLEDQSGPPFKVTCGDGFLYLPWAELPFGPSFHHFFVHPEAEEEEAEDDDEEDADYVMEEADDGETLSLQQQMNALRIQGNATMEYMRHLDSFFQSQYPGSYTAFGNFPPYGRGSGASGSGNDG